MIGGYAVEEGFGVVQEERHLCVQSSALLPDVVELQPRAAIGAGQNHKITACESYCLKQALTCRSDDGNAFAAVAGCQMGPSFAALAAAAARVAAAAKFSACCVSAQACIWRDFRPAKK